MDCATDDCTGLTPVIPQWAHWAAFIAATIMVFVLHTKAQRQPGAALRTYLAAVRPQLLSPAKRSRRRRAVIAVVAGMGLLLVALVVVHAVQAARVRPRAAPPASATPAIRLRAPATSPADRPLQDVRTAHTTAATAV